jgi:3-oxoacyl-[acyl-carrier protein] reductase
LTGFLAGVAREVAPHNVTINAILPGMFDTDRIKSMVSKQSQNRNVTEQTVLNERLATIPAGRLGTAEEFGKMCAFLASDHAGFITGQNILMDGGAFRSSY